MHRGIVKEENDPFHLELEQILAALMGLESLYAEVQWSPDTAGDSPQVLAAFDAKQVELFRAMRAYSSAIGKAIMRKLE